MNLQGRLETERRQYQAGRTAMERMKVLAAVRAGDADIVDRLMAKQQPSTEDVIDAARLLKRYPAGQSEDTPAAILRGRLIHCLAGWGMDEEKANTIARKAWQEGYRPAVGELEVGSGAG